MLNAEVEHHVRAMRPKTCNSMLIGFVIGGNIAMLPPRYLDLCMCPTKSAQTRTKYAAQVFPDRVRIRERYVRKKPKIQNNAMETAAMYSPPYNAGADDSARPSTSASPPNVPYHVGYIPRRVHRIYYLADYTGGLWVLVFIFKGHEHARGRAS